jgi:cytochrome b561|tara:strand:- start:225 stop:467 length:243 start_codon:yes stop_codon:yes gene_type:complete
MKLLIIIGIILALSGVIFSLLSGDVHMSLFGEGMEMQEEHMEGEAMEEPMNHDHGKFVTWGLIVAVIGLALAFAGWKIFD